MDTHFAKAERTADEDLKVEIQIVSENPVIQGLLHSVCGLLAVLDENRQVLAVNDAFLKQVGVNNPPEVLGLRPGEVLKCVHSEEEPAGCGTTKYCSSCGAAIAIVSSFSEDRVVERTCSLTVDKGERQEDMVFKVRSHPIEINDQRYLLLFIQDVSMEEKRATLGRSFFHDISNLMNGLVGASELLLLKHEEDEEVKTVHQLALRLLMEVSVQKCLFKNDASEYKLLKQDIFSDQVFHEMRNIFVNHPVSKGKEIVYVEPKIFHFYSDLSLLIRILSNMVMNAFEASEEGNWIKFGAEVGEGKIVFFVWNKGVIDESLKPRIFQRNVSTKGGQGRGIGTYSMKLFGEDLLGGEVDFTSNPEDGTQFTLTLPIS